MPTPGGHEIASAYVSIALDPAQFTEKLRALLAEAPDQKDIKIEIDPKYLAAIQELKSDLATLENKRVQVRLGLDTGRSMEDLAALDTQIELIRAALRDMMASVDDSHALATLIDLNANMQRVRELVTEKMDLAIGDEMAKHAFDELTHQAIDLRAAIRDMGEVDIRDAQASARMAQLQAQANLLNDTLNHTRVASNPEQKAYFLSQHDEAMRAVNSTDFAGAAESDAQAQEWADRRQQIIDRIKANLIDLRSEIRNVGEVGSIVDPSNFAKVATLRAEVAALGDALDRIRLDPSQKGLDDALSKLEADKARLSSKDWASQFTPEGADRRQEIIDYLKRSMIDLRSEIRSIGEMGPIVDPAELGRVAMLRAELASLGDALARIRVDNSESSLHDALSKLEEDLAQQGSQDWAAPFKAKSLKDDALQGYAQRAAAMRSAIADMAIQKALSPKGDSADALGRQMAFAKAQLDTITSGMQEIRFTTNDDEAKAKIEKIEVRLEALTHYPWNLEVKVQDDGGKIEAFALKAQKAAAGINAWVASATAGAPLIAGAIGIIAAAGAALPGMFAGAGIAGIALAGTGFTDVAAAISAYNQPNANKTLGGQTAAQSAAQLAQQRLASAQSAQGVVTSLQAVASAQQALANGQRTNAQAVQAAQYNAISSVASAQDALRNANQAVTTSMWQELQAQQALFLARQAAIFQLQNYRNQLRDAALAQVGDRLSIQQALLTLRQAQATYTTPLQMEQDRLAVAQAYQAARDQHTAYSQLQITAGEAFAQGVNQNPAVVSAQHALTTARWADVSALRTQGELQGAYNQAVLTAAQGVSNALIAQSQGQQSAVQNLQNAQTSYTLAVQANAVAQQTAAAGVTAQLTTVQQALSNLNGPQLAFVKEWHKYITPLLTDLTTKDSATFFSNIGGGLKDLSRVIAVASPYILQASAGIKTTLEEIGKFFGSKQGQKELNDLFKAGNSFFNSLGGATVTGIKALTNLGVLGAPGLESIGKSINSMSKAFLHWTESPGAKQLIDLGRHMTPVLGGILKGVAGSLSSILGMAALITPVELQTINLLLRGLRDFLSFKPDSFLVATLLTLGGLFSLFSRIGVVGIGKDLVNAGKLFAGAEAVKATSPLGKVIAAIGKNSAINHGLKDLSNASQGEITTAFGGYVEQFGGYVEKFGLEGKGGPGGGGGIPGGNPAKDAAAGESDVTKAEHAGTDAIVAKSGWDAISSKLGGFFEKLKITKLLPGLSEGGLSTEVGLRALLSNEAGVALGVGIGIGTAVRYLPKLWGGQRLDETFAGWVKGGYSMPQLPVIKHGASPIDTLYGLTGQLAGAKTLYNQAGVSEEPSRFGYHKYTIDALDPAAKGFLAATRTAIDHTIGTISKHQQGVLAQQATVLHESTGTYLAQQGVLTKMDGTYNLENAAAQQHNAEVKHLEALLAKAIAKWHDVAVAQQHWLGSAALAVHMTPGELLAARRALAASQNGTLDTNVSALQHRARGGDVLAGHSYIVGEHRAEVFTPSQNGHIFPSTGGAILVRVYIGDQELTQIVDTRVEYLDGRGVQALQAGSVL